DRFDVVMLRLKAGLRQYELAQFLGISQTFLCDVERGRRPVTKRLEEALEAALAQDIDETSKVQTPNVQ
ncbi:MAG: helix-turn-helix transcriptional regulator, partial [Opitutales bacterium]